MKHESMHIHHDHAAAVEPFALDIHATTLAFDMPDVGGYLFLRGLDYQQCPVFRLVLRKEEKDDYCTFTAWIESKRVSDNHDAWAPVAAPYATSLVTRRDGDRTRIQAALIVLGAVESVADLLERELQERDSEERPLQQEDVAAQGPWAPSLKEV